MNIALCVALLVELLLAVQSLKLSTPKSSEILLYKNGTMDLSNNGIRALSVNETQFDFRNRRQRRSRIGELVKSIPGSLVGAVAPVLINLMFPSVNYPKRSVEELQRIINQLNAIHHQLANIDAKIGELISAVCYSENLILLRSRLDEFRYVNINDSARMTEFAHKVYDYDNKREHFHNLLNTLHDAIMGLTCESVFTAAKSKFTADMSVSVVWHLEVLANKLMFLQVGGYALYHTCLEQLNFGEKAAELAQEATDRIRLELQHIRGVLISSSAFMENREWNEHDRWTGEIYFLPPKHGKIRYFDTNAVTSLSPMIGIRLYQKSNRVAIMIRSRRLRSGQPCTSCKIRELASTAWEGQATGQRYAHTLVNRVPDPLQQVIYGVKLVEHGNRVAIGIYYDSKTKPTGAIYQGPSGWNPTHAEPHSHVDLQSAPYADSHWVLNDEQPYWVTGVALYKKENRLAVRMEVRYN